MFNDLFKSTAQKGREYSHWIDLTLNSHFEAVISEIYLTKIPCLLKPTLLGPNKIQKGLAAPMSFCWVNLLAFLFFRKCFCLTPDAEGPLKSRRHF